MKISKKKLLDNITTVEKQILEQNVNLKQIALHYFKDYEIEKLLLSLESCVNLTKLDLSKNMIEDSEVPSILKLIGRLTKLKELNLSHSFLSERGIILLFRACQKKNIQLKIAYSRMSHCRVKLYQKDGIDPVFALRIYDYSQTNQITNLISPRSLISSMPTHQQNYNFDCGAATILNITEYFNKVLEKNNPLLSLRQLMSSINTCVNSGVELENITEWFIQHGFDSLGGFGGDEKLLRYYTSIGIPVIVNTNEWGGHFNIVLGFEAFDPIWPKKDNLILSDSLDYLKGDYDPSTPYSKKNILRFLDEWKDSKNRPGGYIVALPKEISKKFPQWKFKPSQLSQVKENVVYLKDIKW